MFVYRKYECIVMQMLYVCVLCASCVRSQCCILKNLQFVNAGRTRIQKEITWKRQTADPVS